MATTGNRQRHCCDELNSRVVQSNSEQSSSEHQQRTSTGPKINQDLTFVSTPATTTSTTTTTANYQQQTNITSSSISDRLSVKDDNFRIRSDEEASNETYTIVESNFSDDDDDDHYDYDDDDYGNDDQRCGWLSFRPKFLMKFATIQVFVFFSCILVTLQQALSSGYFNSVMTTIEKRFDIPSRVSGAIISTFELGNLVTILFVSYFGTHRHIPVWMGKGIVVTGIGSLLFAVPHFINNDHQHQLDSKYTTLAYTTVTTNNNQLFATNNNNRHQQKYDGNVCKITTKDSNWTKMQNGPNENTGSQPSGNASLSSRQKPPLPLVNDDEYPVGPRSDQGDMATAAVAMKIKPSCNIKTNLFVETHILIFMLAMILIGCGGTPVFTLGTTFIDDHVPKESSSMYIGFMYSMVAFGLVIGFLLGGYLIGNVNENIYQSQSFSYLSNQINGHQQQIHPGHPRWIGAWWLGFIILGVLLILVSLPFFAFPKSLKVTGKRQGRIKKNTRLLRHTTNTTNLMLNTNATRHNDDDDNSMIVINCDTKRSHDEEQQNIRTTMSLGDQSFNQLIIKRNHSMGAISAQTSNNNTALTAGYIRDNNTNKSSLLLCDCDRRKTSHQASELDKQKNILDKYGLLDTKKHQNLLDKQIVIEADLCDELMINNDDNNNDAHDDIHNGRQLLLFNDINNNTAKICCCCCQPPPSSACCQLNTATTTTTAKQDHSATSGESQSNNTVRPNWVSLANLFSTTVQSRSPVVLNKNHTRQRSHDYKLLLNIDDCQQLNYQQQSEKQLALNENRQRTQLIYLCHQHSNSRSANRCVVCLQTNPEIGFGLKSPAKVETELFDNHLHHPHHCYCCHHCRLHNDNKHKNQTTTTTTSAAIHSSPTIRRSELISQRSDIIASRSNLHHNHHHKSTTFSSRSQLNYGKDLKDIPRCMWNLLINPIYIVTCLGSSLELAIVSGFLIFLPKYLETQFALSKSQSSLYSGGIAVPGACFGILFGGYILKRYQMKPKSAIQFVLFINLLCIGFYTVFYFLGCPNPLMAGATMNYADSPASYLLSSTSLGDHQQKVNLTSQCNAPCHCSSNDIEPVCGQDGITYFSPCHAGCFMMHSHSYSHSRSYTNNYSNCTCVSTTSIEPQTILATNPNGNQSRASLHHLAKSGPCPHQCQAIVPFMILLFFMTLVVSITQMPLLMITLRSVGDEERSFALGMQFVIFRLLAYIPAPILFGNVIDGTCLLWRANCGPKSGFCLIYDIEHFRLRYVGLFSALKVAAGLLFFLDWYLICWKSGADQQQGTERRSNARMLPMGTIASSLASLDRLSAFGLTTDMRDEQATIIEKKKQQSQAYLHRQQSLKI